MNTTNKIVLGLVIVTFLFVLKLCSDSKPTETTREETTTTTSVIGTGRINTIADGVELGKVNLWTSTSSSRKVECTVIKGQKVRITEDADPYYYVEAIGRSGCEGYCMKEFVDRD
jgi:hypothetical protein